MKDKLSRAYDILFSMSVNGENQEKIVAAKKIIKDVYEELCEQVEHEYLAE